MSITDTLLNGMRERFVSRTEFEHRLSNADGGGGGGSTPSPDEHTAEDGSRVPMPGEVAGLLDDLREDEEYAKIRLYSGATYEPSRTWDIPPYCTLDFNNAWMRPTGEQDALMRPWPTSQVVEHRVDCAHLDREHELDVFHLLNDDHLTTASHATPWDKDSNNRPWAHSHVGAPTEIIDGGITLGNRPSGDDTDGGIVVVHAENRSSGNGGIHFANGTFSAENVGAGVVMERKEGAAQVNTLRFNAHLERFRCAIHHKYHGPHPGEPGDADLTRAHINANLYRMSLQAMGGSRHVWINEEGKNNRLIADPYFWDSQRYETDYDVVRHEWQDEHDAWWEGHANVRNYTALSGGKLPRYEDKVRGHVSSSRYNLQASPWEVIRDLKS